MLNKDVGKPTPAYTFNGKSVAAAAVFSLCLGLAIGYWTTGPRVSEADTRAQISDTPAVAAAPAPAQPMGPAQMKQMADQQAAPLLAQLRSDPKNAALLLQVGAIYYVAQQYHDASLWYGRAVDADPGNVAARNKLAGSLFREGEVEDAIRQLNRALLDGPTDANSLFNLGMIRLQGKGDARGALAAWQKLLRTNPQLSADRKAAVLQLIAQVMTNLNDRQTSEGARKHEQRQSGSE
ncbi:MAG TPA: tetratricopeptide repeat protein [Acidobacteriaceae bacterium]|nr:tetratricopeptide repeat protein [Acidobacteriaceae bacterium]